MNKLDKSIYEALRFLADNTRAEIKVMSEKHEKDYDENVPKDIEKTIMEYHYINKSGNSRWMITQEGLKQLRELEIIRHRDLTLILSVLAIVISVISFLYSIGWIH